MVRNWMKWLVFAGTLVPWPVSAQQTCSGGIRVEGTITDPTGAVIPGVQVQAASGEKATSDATGHYALPCVSGSSVVIAAQAQGFAAGTTRARGRVGGTVRVNIQLAIASVQTDVQVSADVSGIDSGSGASTTMLNAQAVAQLPDDPDDLLAQLQILAAEYGGDPTTARVTVDGFQNSSALPPKSSIASIRINPDFFSSEYQWPPYSGGTIEITTKPGTSAMHGAVFFTGSPGSVNATDPFSPSPTPASRKRYGFEFSDRLIPQRSDVSLALETRNIDEFNVVNAQTLGPSGQAVPLQQTVAAPQRLWIASARNGWQFGPKDSGFVSFAANINNTQNQGVGGLVLPEAGYTATVGEYDLRLSNTFIASPNLLHETRIGYTWTRNETVPNSSATSLQIAGYFTGGGALTQKPERSRNATLKRTTMHSGRADATLSSSACNPSATSSMISTRTPSTAPLSSAEGVRPSWTRMATPRGRQQPSPASNSIDVPLRAFPAALRQHMRSSPERRW